MMDENNNWICDICINPHLQEAKIKIQNNQWNGREIEPNYQLKYMIS